MSKFNDFLDQFEAKTEQTEHWAKRKKGLFDAWAKAPERKTEWQNIKKSFGALFGGVASAIAEEIEASANSPKEEDCDNFIDHYEEFNAHNDDGLRHGPEGYGYYENGLKMHDYPTLLDDHD